MKTQAPESRGDKNFNNNHTDSHAGDNTISFSDNEVFDTECACNSRFFPLFFFLYNTPNIIISAQLPALRLLTLDYNHLFI